MSERIEKNSPREKRILLWSVLLGVFSLALDLWSKWYVVTRFKLYESIDVLPPVLNFTSVRNYGAAWSILSGHGEILLGIAVVVMAALFWFFRKLCEGCPERYFALLLLVSGVIGNSLDRCFRGAVVDFIHVHWKNVWHYPVFNVADIAICCGVGLFVISNLFRKSIEKSGEKTEGNADGE